MNLDKIKSFFPDFKMRDFNRFEEIISLKWEPVIDYETWEEHKNLFLEMTSADHYKILLECIVFMFSGKWTSVGLLYQRYVSTGV